MTPTEQREAVFALAHRTVVATAAARINESDTDAALVISRYHEDAQALGVPASTAWALLFSAGVVAFTDVLAEAATEHHQSPAAELADFALHKEVRA